MTSEFHLPDSWQWVVLNDVCTINPSQPERIPDEEELVSFVPMAAVEAGTGRIDSSQVRPWKDVKKAYTRFQNGDVLFAKITPCMENGKSALAIGLTGGVGAGSTEFYVLRSDAMVPKLLLYFVLQESFRRDARAKMRGAAGQLRVPPDFMDSYPVPLPPLAEQQRIVAEIETQLTRLDAAVAALERARANLKRYRVAILKAASEGRLVPTEAALAHAEGHNYEPADALLGRILKDRRAEWEAEQLPQLEAVVKRPKNYTSKAKYVEPEPTKAVDLIALAEGWAWARAEQVCDFITKGTTPAANKLQAGAGDIPFIKVYNLTFDGTLDFSINPTFVSTDTHKGELARSRVIPGDVLMNIVGPPLGKVAIVPDTFDEWNMNQAVAVFRPLPGVLPSYLAICLLAGDVLNWATRRAKATAGQFNLTLEICRDLPLPIPPAAEQARIVVEAERRLAVIDGTERLVIRSLRRADRVRQAILKQAFDGRLADQDPEEEPATALLERMRVERVGRPDGRMAFNRARSKTLAATAQMKRREVRE